MKNFILFFFLILTSFKAFSLEVTLTQGSVKPTPIAITDFFSNENNILKVGKNISMVISDNLERSGLFLPLDNKAFMQDSESLANQPRFEDWKVIKAQHLIAGKILKNENKISVTAMGVGFTDP